MSDYYIALTDINKLTGLPFSKCKNLPDPNPYGKTGAESIREWPCMQNNEPFHKEPKFTETRVRLEIR